MRLSNPAQLGTALSQRLAPIYLITGEEPLIIQEALDAIRAAARAQGYSEREVLDADKGFEWQRLLDTCNTPSLFAPRRIVEVRMGAGPDAAGAQVLQALAKSPAPDVLLIVTTGKLDSRARNGAWYAALEQAGAALYVWPVKSEELPQWIVARLRAAGVQADADAVRLLAERTEGNLLAAAQELRKLALLHPGAKLGSAEVEAAVADSAHYEVFGWLNTVMAGDARAAVRGLQGLRDEGEDVLPILALLARALRELYVASKHYARSRNANAAVEAAGVFRSNQPAYARATARATPAQVLGWLRRCARIDAQVKSGAQAAAWEDLLTLTLAAAGAGKALRAR